MKASAVVRRYFGDRRFYAMVLGVALPIIVQNAFSNLAGLLDGIMVGSTGTEAMSGVSIVNQILMVFYLGIFGAVSGANIFGAQYYGAKNYDGVRNCFRYKLVITAALTLAVLLILSFFGRSLIHMYLLGEADEGSADLALESGMTYLRLMLPGLVPYAVAQVYAGTQRETGNARLPMIAGVSGVCVNLLFNNLLIFGNLGFPRMGVAGAALATVISRIMEMLVIVSATHARAERFPFIRGAYRHFRIPASLTKAISAKGAPLMVNEIVWALGMALLSQSYSLRGLNVVAAMNINRTVNDLFNVVFLSIGATAGILVGQALGASQLEEARSRSRKIIVFSTCCCVVMGLLMVIAAQFVPNAYNTTEEVRALARRLIAITAVCMPIQGCYHGMYFTLRAGGKSMVTLIMDSGFVWGVNLPLALCLVHLTKLPIIPLYAICQAADIIKCFIGRAILRRGGWVRNIVDAEV